METLPGLKLLRSEHAHHGDVGAARSAAMGPAALQTCTRSMALARYYDELISFPQPKQGAIVAGFTIFLVLTLREIAVVQVPSSLERWWREVADAPTLWNMRR